LGRPNPFCCISVSSPMSRGWLGAHQAAGELLLSCICGRLLMEPQAAPAVIASTVRQLLQSATPPH